MYELKVGDARMYEVVKGKHCPQFNCIKCGRKVLTRQKRVKADFTYGKKNACCRCGIELMNQQVKGLRKSIAAINRVKRRIRDKDLVLEAL